MEYDTHASRCSRNIAGYKWLVRYLDESTTTWLGHEDLRSGASNFLTLQSRLGKILDIANCGMIVQMEHLQSWTWSLFSAGYFRCDWLHGLEGLEGLAGLLPWCRSKHYAVCVCWYTVNVHKATGLIWRSPQASCHKNSCFLPSQWHTSAVFGPARCHASHIIDWRRINEILFKLQA
jgi:hypothetical protein